MTAKVTPDCVGRLPNVIMIGTAGPVGGRVFGHRVVVITDNAKYHHARLHKEWREKHAGNFALDYLPPYSPELNPIERVWKLTRRRCLHNQYFAKLEDVITVVESEFAGWAKRNTAQTMRTYLGRCVYLDYYDGIY